MFSIFFLVTFFSVLYASETSITSSTAYCATHNFTALEITKREIQKLLVSLTSLIQLGDDNKNIITTAKVFVFIERSKKLSIFYLSGLSCNATNVNILSQLQQHAKIDLLIMIFYILKHWFVIVKNANFRFKWFKADAK